MTKIAFYFYLFLFWTLFSIEELFCVLNSSKYYKYDYGNNKNPWIIIICFTIPFLGIRVADQCLKQQDDTKSIIDLIKMFELIWSFWAKYFIPNIYIYGQRKHHDSDVNLSGRQNSHTILYHCLQIQNRPVLCCYKNFLIRKKFS